MDGADEGNRTPVSSLGSLRSAIEPHPRQAASYQPPLGTGPARLPVDSGSSGPTADVRHDRPVDHSSHGGAMTSPFGPLVLVADPSQARGQVGLQLPRLEGALRASGQEYRTLLLRRPGEARAAVREALQGGERFIVAVGDDGMVHEVVNGM